MCPICIGTAGWLAAGTVSAGGFGALLKRRQMKGQDDGDNREDSGDASGRKP
jgi:hypothetical protein